MTELVVRTDTGHVRANRKWYTLSALVDKAFARVTASGSRNPAFDMPPWFYTESPYGDEIESLGCAEVTLPTNYQKEYVLALGTVWRSREPAWPSIFNCEVKHQGVCLIGTIEENARVIEVTVNVTEKQND